MRTDAVVCASSRSWPGSVSAKWLTRIWVRDRVHDGPGMGGTAYRVPTKPIVPGSDDPANLRLTHRRCNAPGLDHTAEVGERIRRRAEAELFAASRKRKRKAA